MTRSIRQWVERYCSKCQRNTFMRYVPLYSGPADKCDVCNTEHSR